MNPGYPESKIFAATSHCKTKALISFCSTCVLFVKIAENPRKSGYIEMMLFIYLCYLITLCIVYCDAYTKRGEQVI